MAHPSSSDGAPAADERPGRVAAGSTPRRALLAATGTGAAGAATGVVIERVGAAPTEPLAWAVALLLAGVGAASLLAGHRSEQHGDPAARGWWIIGALAALAAVVRVVPLGHAIDAADLGRIAGLDGTTAQVAWALVGLGIVILVAGAGRAAWCSLAVRARRRLRRAGVVAAVVVASSIGLAASADTTMAVAAVQALGALVVLAVAIDVLVLQAHDRSAPADLAVALAPVPSLADLVELHRPPSTAR